MKEMGARRIDVHSFETRLLRPFRRLAELVDDSLYLGDRRALGISLWKSFSLLTDTAEAPTGGPSKMGIGSEGKVRLPWPVMVKLQEGRTVVLMNDVDQLLETLDILVVVDPVAVRSRTPQG